MLRQTISRIRAHSISLPTQTRRFFALDVSSAKARAMNWEPALQLPTNSWQNDNPDAEGAEAIPWITTYSAFDPGMMRPLLLMSGFTVASRSVGNVDGAKEAKPKSAYPQDEEDVSWMITYSAFDPGMIRPPQSGSIDEAITEKLELLNPENDDIMPWMTTYSAFDPGMTRPLLPLVKQSGFIVTTKEIKDTKPWPYSLPEFLRSKAGTTFGMAHGGAEENKTSQRIGVLQALLYGLPEPEKVEAKKGVLYKVLYGVKEDEGEDKKSDVIIGK